MVGKNFAKELIIKSELVFLNMLPARIELRRAEVELMSEKDKEFLLRNLLMELKEEYDYIIIDSPPSLNLLTINAINAADLILVPLQCEYYALEGLSYQLEIIKAIKKSLNPDIKIAGILLTMLEDDENISNQIVEDVRKHFKDMVFKTVIPRNSNLRDSSSSGKPPFLSDIMSAGAQSYLELAKEFILRWPAR